MRPCAAAADASAAGRCAEAVVTVRLKPPGGQTVTLPVEYWQPLGWRGMPSLTQEQKAAFVRDGTLILPNRIPLALAQRAKAVVDAALAVEVTPDAQLPRTGHRRGESPLNPGRVDMAGAQYEGESLQSHDCFVQLLTHSDLLPCVPSLPRCPHCLHHRCTALPLLVACHTVWPCAWLF